MTDPDRLAIAILAGGEGSRIGGRKPLATLAGSTLIERAYGQATNWSDLVVVALRSASQLETIELPWIKDVPDIEGPLAGLASGLDWARDRHAKLLLTIPCDMPFLPDDLATRLLSEIGNRAVAVASSGGNLHPVCALWRTAAADHLPAYCQSGRRSLRGFADEVGQVGVEWPITQMDPFFNINRLEELVAAWKLLER